MRDTSTQKGFLHWIVQFMVYMKAVKLSSVHTLRNYAIDLNVLKEFVNDNVLLKSSINRTSKITPYNFESFIIDSGTDVPMHLFSTSVLRKFLLFLSMRTKTKKTFVRRVSAVRSFFKFLAKRGIVHNNIVEGLLLPKLTERLPTFVSYNEIKILLDQPDVQCVLGVRDKTMMELMYGCGLRVSEVVNLNIGDICVDTLSMRIKGKGGKNRMVPFTQNIIDWLYTYINHKQRSQGGIKNKARVDANAVFLNKNGYRLSSRSVARKIKYYLLRSGLSCNITPHTFRHAIACHWLERGLSIKYIQKLLGHVSLDSTAIYAKVHNKLMVDSYNKCHPRVLFKM